MVQWAALVPASLAVAATPGANHVLALRNGARAGTSTAVVASLGRFAAFVLMVVAVALGARHRGIDARLAGWLATENDT